MQSHKRTRISVYGILLVVTMILFCGNAVAASNLVGLWHLDESTGALAYDSSGNDLTMSNCAVVTSVSYCATPGLGKFLNGLNFAGAGSNQVARLAGGDSSLTRFGASPFTVEAWINWSGDSPTNHNDTIVAKWSSVAGAPATDSFWLGVRDGILTARLSDGSGEGSRSGAAVSPNSWHHVAMTVTPGAHTWLNIYLDGVAVRTEDLENHSQVGDALDYPVSIGGIDQTAWPAEQSPTFTSATPGWLFAGRIDEVRLWSRALAPYEVLADAQAGLRGLWHLDTVNNTTHVTPDSSGYTNNATLTTDASTRPTIGGTGPQVWFGKTLQLNSANKQYATIPDNPTVDITNAITVDAWIKLASVGQSSVGIVNKGNVGNYAESYSLFLDSDNKINFLVNNSGTSGGRVIATSPTVLTTIPWYHVAGTYDGAQVCVYVNDGAGTCAAQTGQINVTPNALLIGKADRGGTGDTGDTFFIGRIDEVHLWARPLIQDEIFFLFGHCFNTSAPYPSCAELIVPSDMSQIIDSNAAEVFPVTYFQYKATIATPERAMPLWFMVSDPGSTMTTGTPGPNHKGCAVDIGSTPGTPTPGGLIACMAGMSGPIHGKTALISGKQIDVTPDKKSQPATTLHVLVTLDGSNDTPPVNFQWR